MMGMVLDKMVHPSTPSNMTGHILIVDDDPRIRDVVRIALQAAGFTTCEAANGQAALTEIGRTQIDLVVLVSGTDPIFDGAG